MYEHEVIKLYIMFKIKSSLPLLQCTVLRARCHGHNNNMVDTLFCLLAGAGETLKANLNLKVYYSYSSY